ncbi:MAG: PAS domain S-box protein [Candidatus Hydrogenedentes bacterium]|nr:PAS domain S-box protein [Candidatus Hydrogenedentota bacterium]
MNGLFLISAIVVSALLVAAARGAFFSGRRKKGNPAGHTPDGSAPFTIETYRDFLAWYANDVVLLCDNHRRIIDANRRVCDIYGFQREELIGMDAADLRAPSARARLDDLLNAVKVNDGAFYETVHVRKDGTPFPVEVSIRSIKQGGLTYYESIIRDVSHRKHAEEELQRLNRTLAAIIQCRKALIKSTHEDALMQEICRLCVEAGGYRVCWIGLTQNGPAKLVKPVAVIGDAENYARSITITWDDSPTGRGPVGTAIRTCRPSLDNDIPGSTAFQPWRGQAAQYGLQSCLALPLCSGDSAFGAVAIYSERKEAFGPAEVHLFSHLTDDLAFGIMALRARDAKAQLEEQLRQAQRLESIGRLAGGVAHDFNNLLTIILCNSEALLTALPAENKRLRDQVTDIENAGERARDLTRQLLAFSRKQILEMRLLDLNDLVARTQRMLQRLIGEDIEITATLRAIEMVRADENQLQQILMNLAVNARDAMPSGGRLMIETGSVMLDEEYARDHAGASPGHYVLLAVSDTGCGMTSEVIEHIFEPFFTTKELGRGTGLGLATVYGIVKQHNGYIWVYSEPGRGTTFKIYLPVVAALGEIEPQLPEDSTSLQGAETILVVEDETSVRDIVARMLEHYGYRVFCAATLDEALGHAGNGVRFDLLLTDVIMPKVNGKQVYEAIAALQPAIRVLYMSGHPENVIGVSEAMDTGRTFLPKPFTSRGLGLKVRQALNA